MVYYNDVEIQCANKCGSWKWSGGAIKRMNGEVPDVCGICYDNPDLELIMLECQNKECQNSFEYPPRWQKNIERKGHSQPALCETCRQANKDQKPVRLKCSACEEDYTYTAQYVISFKRQEGWFEGRSVCRPCFEDPGRAKRLKEKREERKKKEEEEKQKPRFEDTVGYYLLHESPETGRHEWESIVDADTYYVDSNVQSYDVSDDADWYASIPDRKGPRGFPTPRTVLGHIMEGGKGEGHGWQKKLGTDDPQVVVSTAAPIAEGTDTDIIECTEGRFNIKYDTSQGIVVFIVRNEDPSPPHRLNSSFPKSQKKVAESIWTHRWDLT